jgi:Flp pilus assembly pilin Flp
MMFARLLREGRGNDLVEYALLGATIGLAAVAAWDAMGEAILAAYSSWGTSVQELWEPNDPGS